MSINSGNRRLSSSNSLAYMGSAPLTPPNLITNTFAPTVNDYKNMSIGDLWLVIDPETSPEPTPQLWCLAAVRGMVATWVQLYPSSGSGVSEMVTNSGTATEMNATINMLGQNIIQTSGAGNTVTISTTNGTVGQLIIGGPIQPNWNSVTSVDGTVAIAEGINSLNFAVDDGAGLNEVITDLGSAVPDNGELDITSTVLLNTAASGNTVTINLDRASNGQVPIGRTAGVSRYANITSDDGTINITNGPNSIDLSIDSATSRASFFYYQAINSSILSSIPVFQIGTYQALTQLFDGGSDVYAGSGTGASLTGGATFTAPVDGIYLIGYSTKANRAQGDIVAWLQSDRVGSGKWKLRDVYNVVPISAVMQGSFQMFLFAGDEITWWIQCIFGVTMSGKSGSDYGVYIWGELISQY